MCVSCKKSPGSPTTFYNRVGHRVQWFTQPRAALACCCNGSCACTKILMFVAVFFLKISFRSLACILVYSRTLYTGLLGVVLLVVIFISSSWLQPCVYLSHSIVRGILLIPAFCFWNGSSCSSCCSGLVFVPFCLHCLTYLLRSFPALFHAGFCACWCLLCSCYLSNLSCLFYPPGTWH